MREVKEETGLDVEIVRNIGEYHEQGVQGGVEYDYYPACFLAKKLSGEINKQESEIEETSFSAWIRFLRLWRLSIPR